MDSETLKIILYVLAGGVVLFGLIRLASKPKKCAVCGVDTKDEYKDEKDKNTPLCKNHLVERWKKDVISSVHNMMVIEPDFVHYPYAYLYATAEKLKEWKYTKEDQNNISTILDTIQGKICKECGSKATVAYFKKEDYNFPYFAKISALPVYLCKGCAVKKVEPFLRSSPKDFVEGVYAPTNDRGIYHVQEF